MEIVYDRPMSPRRSIRLAFVLSSFVLAVPVFSQTSLSGEVRGVDGRAIKGAQVQVERQGGRASAVAATTDGKGRFLITNLPAGQYTVSAKAGGASSQSQVVKLFSKRETISLRLAAAAASSNTVAKKKKKMVWVPAQTGSRIGGNWVEVDDSAPAADTTQEAAALQRLQSQQANTLPRPLAGGGR